MEATMYFKRGRDRNYMMRSEKRPGYPNTPPKRKKPRNSFWYQTLTIILLILLCPVGLILLWRKRLRWPNPTKLIATLLSLILFFLELGAALWYPFEDERLQNAQMAASQAIRTASEHCADFFEEAGENWTIFMDNHREIGAAAGNHALGLLLDAIASPTPIPTQVPPLDLKPTNGGMDGIAEILNKPTPTPTPSPTPTPTATPTATATPDAEPTETPDALANTLNRPTPSSNVSLPVASGSPAINGSATPVPPVTPTPTPTATPVPTPTPTATPEPTIDPATIPRLMEPGEVLIWHTSNGKWYHKGPQCGTMSNASQHTLGSAVSKGKVNCPYCFPVEAKWADVEDPVVYVSADSFWHTTPDCESNTADWTLMMLDEARADRSLAPCDACGSRYYVDGVPEALKGAVQVIIEQITSAPSASAQTGATPKPTPIYDGLNLSEVTNGDVLVYYTDNTSHYHRRERCASSATSTFIPHKLMDALIAGKQACPVCEAPEPETN